MNTDKIPAAILPSRKKEERAQKQMFAFQDNRTSFAIQRHLIQAMNEVAQFALPKNIETLIKQHLSELEKLVYQEDKGKGKKNFVAAINNLLKEARKAELKVNQVDEAWRLFQELYNEFLKEQDIIEEEEEEEEEFEEEEDMIEGEPLIPIFSLMDVPWSQRDNYFILYRSMSKKEFEELKQTIGGGEGPIFKYPIGKNKYTEKFFATSLPYLKAGMSKKGDRKGGVTVEILLNKQVLPDLLYNKKYAGYSREAKSEVYKSYGLEPDSQAKKHGIYVKEESNKGAYNITFGFRLFMKLLSEELPKYIVQINQLSDPLPDRKPVTSFGIGTKPSDFGTQPIGMQPVAGRSVPPKSLKIQYDEQMKGEDPHFRQAIYDSILQELTGRARAIALSYGLFAVGGEQWLCYIRCVLQAFGAVDQLDQIKEILKDKNLFNSISKEGITIGTEIEREVQRVIMHVIGRSYFVIALAGDQAARSLEQVGHPIVLLHTGVHFSLVQGDGVYIMKRFEL